MHRFVFTLKGNYSSWEDFTKLAKKSWVIYKKHLAPESIKRIGTRFINELTITEHTSINISDYWKTVPMLSPEIEGDIGSFNMQLFLPDIYGGLRGLINERVVTDPKNKALTLILDIDVYKDKGISKNERSLWTAFHTLRNGKNKLFKASTTEKFRGAEDV